MTRLEVFFKSKRLETAIERHVRHSRDSFGSLYKPEDDQELQSLLDEYCECLRILVIQ